MTKLSQVLIGVVAFIVIFFILVPLLPDIYFLQLIARAVLVIIAIVWVMRLGGIDIL